MITNPKIERKKADIKRTETKLVDVRTRLRQQKEELTKLEDDEIVAMFRSEVITEDDFSALLRSRRESAEESEESDNSPEKREEDLLDAISKD